MEEAALQTSAPAALAGSVLWLLTYLIFPLWMFIHAVSRKHTDFVSRLLGLAIIIILHPYGAYLYGLFATGSRMILILSLIMLVYSGKQAIDIRNIEEEQPKVAQKAYREMAPVMVRKAQGWVEDYRRQDVSLIEYLKRSGKGVREGGFFKHFQQDENRRNRGRQGREESGWKIPFFSKEGRKQQAERKADRERASVSGKTNTKENFRVAVRPEELSGLKNQTGSLIAAAQSGDLPRVEALIHAGADINKRSDMGTTALMEAAQLGYKSIVGLLLEAGADPGIKTPQGQTAAALARLSFRHEIADLIEQAANREP